MQILKLGGSVITNKKGRMEADLVRIDALAEMLGRLWAGGRRDIVLVHGAGSFGHALVIEYGIKDGIRSEKDKEGYRKTQEACAQLSKMVVGSLRSHGVDAITVQPHDIIVQKNKRIVKFDERRVFDLLAMGKMPVLHGDMVPDEALGGSVCSGDQMVAYLAKKAERTVLGTDVDGIMADGKLVGKIDRKNFAAVEKHLKESDSPDVTGGMAGKIKELKGVGGEIYVANANYPKRIEALLLGKKALCTQMEF